MLTPFTFARSSKQPGLGPFCVKAMRPRRPVRDNPVLSDCIRRGREAMYPG